MAFKKSTTAAMFYYMDNFLLIGSGSSIYLAKYFVDSNTNDIQRYILKK